jgi:anti-sigma regulatory factor (Ser/Thr protein kinase)
MARIDIAPLTHWITEAAIEHGADLPAHLMARLQISRRRAGHLLQKLVAAQWLNLLGSARRPQYQPGPLRQVVRRYALPGLQEDLPWRRDFAPRFELPSEVACMAEHAFTELLNNAIDHSGGASVTVSMRQTPLQMQLLVSDDGCGLFERMARSFDIQDPRLAMLELSKGKLTSAPDRHCGHGLFFTSRLADIFDLDANAAAFQCCAWGQRGWKSRPAGPRQGTSIYLAITLDTPRTLDGVLREHSNSGYGLERTSVPLLLLTGKAPGAMLASRADAKRAVHRLQAFRHAQLDFTGIAHVGHGFADEMFRVFALQQPGLELQPVGMAAQVAAMVGSVRESVALSALGRP